MLALTIRNRYQPTDAAVTAVVTDAVPDVTVPAPPLPSPWRRRSDTCFRGCIRCIVRDRGPSQLIFPLVGHSVVGG